MVRESAFLYALVSGLQNQFIQDISLVHLTNRRPATPHMFFLNPVATMHLSPVFYCGNIVPERLSQQKTLLSRAASAFA